MLSHERYIPPRLQLVPHRFGSSTRHGTISELMTTSLQQVVSTKATCRVAVSRVQDADGVEQSFYVAVNDCKFISNS